MRILITAVIILSFAVRAAAQETIPFEFTSEDDNRLIKENDTAKYYVASDDTTDIVCINEESSVYRLLNKEHKLIADGSFITDSDKYLQDGKWTAHFSNGKIKMTGYYDKGKPIGTWEEFYDNGKPKAISNYAVLKDESGLISSCLSGSYHEYYKTGRLKTDGFYAAARTSHRDTIEVQDPVTNARKRVVTENSDYQPEKTGHWETFDESGDREEKKKEEE